MNTAIRFVCLIGLVLLGGCSSVTRGLQAGATEAFAEPVLLFGIGMHIEPLGFTHQGFPGGPMGMNYRTGPLFQGHVEDIRTVAQIVEKHGGRMTVQAQSPFTNVALERRSPILAELESRGHEKETTHAKISRRRGALPAATQRTLSILRRNSLAR